MSDDDIKKFMDMYPTCPSPTNYPNTFKFYSTMYFEWKRLNG